MGTDPTRFMLYRRLLGSNNDEDYQIIWETTGTESSYYYEDSRALAGQFYQYRVVAQSKYLNDDNQLVYDDVSSKICDGFCQTRGIISGRITYGTGTAVANARVLLAKSGEGDILVKALLNEREVTLPVASTSTPYYYKWADLRKYWSDKLAKFAQ